MSTARTVQISASSSLVLPQLSSVKAVLSKSGIHFWKLSLTSAENATELLTQVRSQFSSTTDVAFIPSSLDPRAIFFDMDATVIEQESIVEIARSIGKTEEVSRITEAAMSGQLPFKEALLARLALLRGVPTTIFADILPRLTYTLGIEALLGFAQKRGFKTYLVSGGFTDLAEPLAKRLGFHGTHSNKLETKDGKLTGNVVGAIVDGDAKAQFVAQKVKELGLTRDQIVVVGDGANDLKMMALSNCAAGFRPRPILYPNLHVCMGLGDHRFLVNVLERAIQTNVTRI